MNTNKNREWTRTNANRNNKQRSTADERRYTQMRWDRIDRFLGFPQFWADRTLLEISSGAGRYGHRRSPFHLRQSAFICGGSFFVSLRLSVRFIDVHSCPFVTTIRVHSRLFTSGRWRRRRGRGYVAEGESADNRFQVHGRFRVRNRASRGQILRRRTRGESHKFVAN